MTVLKQRRQPLCKQCRTCIYQWANCCPGLTQFNRQKCAQMRSK